MLVLHSISKTFNRGSKREVHAVRNFDLEVEPNEFVILVGANASGKTTLFDIICGITRPDAGTVAFGGNDITKWPAHARSRYITRIYQSREAALPKSLLVSEVLHLASAVGGRRETMAGRPPASIDVAQALERVRPGLANILREQVAKLSGGEYQLLALTVALLLAESYGGRERLLLLDEHTAHLDPEAQETVLQITARLVTENGLTAIMTTHDLAVATNYGSRQVVMREGMPIWTSSGRQKITDEKTLREMMKGRGALDNNARPVREWSTGNQCHARNQNPPK